MPSITLPQEILDEITDIIGLSMVDKDSSSLRNLAQASKHHFLHRARPHLFRVLPICHRLRNAHNVVLKRNPELLKHVRVVYLTMRRGDAFATDSWTARKLELILKGLQDLHALYLHVEDKGLVNGTAIYSLLQPSLVHFSWTNLDLSSPLRCSLYLAHSLPNLRSLNFNGLRCIPVRTKGDSPKPECPRCRTWSCWDLSGILARCRSSLYGSLAALKINVDGLNQHLSSWSVIDAASNISTLKALEITYESSYYWNARVNTDIQCFDEGLFTGRALRTFPSLLYLGISVNLNAAYMKWGEEGLGRIVGSFIHFSASIIQQARQPSLEIISITPRVLRNTRPYLPTPPHPPTDTFFTHLVPTLSLPQGDRRQLDQVLSDTSLLPSLKHARLRMIPWRDLGDVLDAISPETPLHSQVMNGLRLGLTQTRTRLPVTVDYGADEETSARFDAAERKLLNGLIPGAEGQRLADSAFWLNEWPVYT